MKTTSYINKDYLKSLGDISAEDMLKTIGLQARRSTLRALVSSTGIFAAGILLGAGVGMAFAPRRGEQIRREIRERAGTVKSKMGHYAEKAGVSSGEQQQSPSFDA